MSWYKWLMTTTIMVGIQNSVLVLESSNRYKVHEALKGTDPQSIEFDALNPDRAYCGTFGNGLWKTDDGGQTWSNIGKDDISSPNVMSVAVSSLNPSSGNRFNKVYVGTEPSALHISNDGGESWEKMETLNKLPSSKSWSFPPRPWTHHIRWIEPDANNPNYVFAAIEAGALVQSHDGGRTWIDRVEQGPYDTHTLATHPKAPKRLYSSAGDGYFESFDYGESWTTPMEGLKHSYLYGIAVDSGNPQNVIVSASMGPSSAYSSENAESFVYKKVEDSRKWRVVSNGLPEPEGTTIATFVSNPKVSGEFYAVNNRGLFMSTDSGDSWKKLDTPWPKEYLSQTPWALAISER
jgi:photosystem II stability/assembly factor-like uncharacterized protein